MRRSPPSARPSTPTSSRALGADEVIDYTRDDFTRAGRRWDVILDAAGTAPFSRAEPVLNKDGRLLRVNGTLGDLLQAPLLAIAADKRIVVSGASPGHGAMAELARLVEQGRFTPVVGKVYPFEQIAAAYRDVASGHKRGSIVLSMATRPPVNRSGRRPRLTFPTLFQPAPQPPRPEAPRAIVADKSTAARQFKGVSWMRDFSGKIVNGIQIGLAGRTSFCSGKIPMECSIGHDIFR